MSATLRRGWFAVWKIIGGVRLRIKVMGIALAMIALLGLGILGLVREVMTRVLTWELEQRGLSIAHDVAGRSTDLILTNNLYPLHELIRNTVLSNEDVRYAFLLDPHGRILADSFGGGFPPDLLAANVLPPGESHHVELLQTEEGIIQDIAVPIFESRAGIVRVGMSLRRLEATLAHTTRQILLATLLVSILGIVISTGLTWLVTRPILGLAEATARVAQGDLSHRLVPWADDEIGQLQNSFNAMVNSLAQSRQSMEIANARLARRNRELLALYGISRALSGPLGLSEALERALEHVIGMMRTTGGWICMLNDDGSCYICASMGEPSRADVGTACCRQCTACRQAALARKPIVVSPVPASCPVYTSQNDPTALHQGHVIVPILTKERVAGLLNLVCTEENCFEQEGMGLLAAVGRQLGLAFENVRLWEELRHKEAMRGQLLRKIITAQEEERRRIARELHDQTGQAITSLLVGLKVLEGANSLEQARALASDMRNTLSQTLDEVRNLALELRPSALDDLGLVPALARYVGMLPARFGFQVDFVAAGMDDQRLPREVESTLYRIAQEALSNVARHARATHASVLLERREGVVVMLIEDNGVGFDAARVIDSARERERLGLFGMMERASLVGGRLTIESRPGAGTTISVEVPLEST